MVDIRLRSQLEVVVMRWDKRDAKCVSCLLDGRVCGVLVVVTD